MVYEPHHAPQQPPHQHGAQYPPPPQQPMPPPQGGSPHGETPPHQPNPYGGTPHSGPGGPPGGGNVYGAPHGGTGFGGPPPAAPGMPPPSPSPPRPRSRKPLWIGLGAGGLVLVLSITLALTGVFSGDSGTPEATADDSTVDTSDGSEEPADGDTPQDDVETEVLYTSFSDPCEVIDIESYFAWASGGSPSTRDAGTSDPDGETGEGDCNFTKMDDISVYVIAYVKQDVGSADGSYDYHSNLAAIGELKEVEVTCASEWEQSVAYAMVTPYPFDGRVHTVVMHSNLMVSLAITMTNDGPSNEEMMTLACNTLELFATTYSS